MNSLSNLTTLQTLFEKGFFQIEDTVASHIPEFAANGKDNITIRMLLTHTSGKKIGGNLHAHTHAHPRLPSRL